MNLFRTTVRTAAVPLAVLLAATGCSSDEKEPRTPGEQSSVGTPSSAGPSASPSASPSATAASSESIPGADSGSTPAGPEGPGGEPTGWVLADALDTKAPVDARSLPDGVRVEQVADARRAWNDRSARLRDGTGCAVVGTVWIAGADEASGRTIVIGPQRRGEVACSSQPLMTVDAATNAVLEGEEFAGLL